MRLWHQSLLQVLPGPQLASQHRECCALRGKGWGRKHSTVDYVFEYPIELLVGYHLAVIREVSRRTNWTIDPLWCDPQYRGKELGIDYHIDAEVAHLRSWLPLIYPEHTEQYLTEGLDNMISKLKTKLEGHISQYGMLDHRTLKVSTELDQLIVLYQNRAF